jgi:hypothetical protein
MTRGGYYDRLVETQREGFLGTGGQATEGQAA